MIRLVTKFYQRLIACYPENFRVEFGDEMQEIFVALATDTLHTGSDQIWKLAWRELRSWPGSVLREHLQARRKKMSMNRFVDQKPLSRIELLAAMIVFLLPIFSIFLTTGISLPQWVNVLLVFIFWGCVIFALGLAITRRLPRWSLSYFGFLLSIGVILSRYERVWGWIYTSIVQSFGPRSLWPLWIRIIYGGGFAIIMVFSILVGALILISLLRLIPYTRAIWQRIRADWTQLSFLLYGSLVFFILLAFEEYRYDEIWKFAAWICLALGAWIYLRAKGQKQRILALMGGATGAMWIVTIGTWVLIPLQDWQGRYSLISMRDLRWTDTSTVIIGWICMLLVLVAPALLNFLPHTPPPDDQENVAHA